MNTALCQKIYLALNPPTEEDSRSAQIRILETLKKTTELVEPVKMTLPVMRRLEQICPLENWNITVTLCWDENRWLITNAEPGNHEQEVYGLAVDLGSTTVVMQLVDCHTGKVLAQTSVRNRQRERGLEILSRIFYAKDQPDHLEELRSLTVDSISEGISLLESQTGIKGKNCSYMVISGNNAMIHFLAGIDPFPVFSSPYAVWADQIGFCSGEELQLPISGMVYCIPARANYLGGDIISGLIDVDIYHQKQIQLFFDVGTNGELVIGNQDFLIAGAGAAGPALEGEAIQTGMRASRGAVSKVHLSDNTFTLSTIDDAPPVGICGSGITDMIAELYLNGWIDTKGRFLPEQSDKIAWQEDRQEYGVCYAQNLWFYESDIAEFLKAKAAACTMIQILLQEIGIEVEDVENLYMAGAFGTHIDKHSAVTIGMYPDIPLEKIHRAGNSSLNGARKLLLDKNKLEEIPKILALMSYLQFGSVDNFLSEMTAAAAIPHTNIEKYPSVEEERRRRSGK